MFFFMHDGVPSNFLHFLFFLFQLITKEQVYVCPGGGPPRSLPAGVLPEAVQAGVNLDSALKQVRSSSPCTSRLPDLIAGLLGVN